MRQRGFTLIELVVVIAIIGIIAAVLTVFLRPAIDGYLDTRRRANFSDMADTALRRMGQDIRSAVPNSIRMAPAAPTTCFQLVPTASGGRYRIESGIIGGAAVGNPLDVTRAITSFDVLSRMSTVPAANDWVVVNNQNSGDVYSGANRAQIQGVAVLPAALQLGQHRITLTAAKQFSPGYDGGRFQIVANAAQTLVYSCAGGTLFRAVTGFSNAFPAAQCGAGDIVATNVACNFLYTPNQGATQQSGFIEMQLTWSDAVESATLVHGVHVENTP